jgi:hypothetical protein
MNQFTRVASLVAMGAMAVSAAAACRQAPAPAPAKPAVEAYMPGLGEFMMFQQERHTKLWLAAEAKNWKLAAYEVDELGEGFDDIVKYHPADPGLPVAPKDAIPIMIREPLGDVKAAVEKQDTAAFETAYDELTSRCNACHQATDHGFNVLQRPSGSSFPDQAFAPAKAK